MIWPALLCALGLPAAFLLLRKVPRCGEQHAERCPPVSVIIPARNEERNLPRLLGSIREKRGAVTEVIVVDDHSTDSTAETARSYGARVVESAPLPAGWTGKTWACAQAAEAAGTDVLLFLDADTWFVGEGCERILALYTDERVAVSVLPWHVTERWYEQLSLFFNLLMAAGAGGFGVGGRPRLFGQSLLISRYAYEKCGGHGSVRGFILENFRLASSIYANAGRTVCRGGRGVLAMRMFPEGFAQMCEGWTKAFADGAVESGALVTGSAVVWISALFSTFFLLIAPADYGRLSLAIVYLLLAAQVAWFARQLGNYRALTAMLYPVPLIYYCAIFGRSLYRRALGRRSTWRGRPI